MHVYVKFCNAHFRLHTEAHNHAYRQDKIPTLVNKRTRLSVPLILHTIDSLRKDAKQGQMNWKLHANVLFYIIGSCLFIIGSIFFHPQISRIDPLYKIGVLTFTFGSILFCFASFQQLVTNFQSVTSNDSRSCLDETTSLDIDSALSLCRNTIGSISGFLFAVGSVGFWPTYGHCGAIVGNWLYRCGATLGVLSCMCLLIRLQVKSIRFTMMKLVTILSLLGSVGFLIGGGFFLSTGHDAEGSLAWLAGSIAFLLSSLLIYKL